MKNTWITIALLSMLLFACGGSEGDTTTETPKESSVTNLSNTDWVKECVPYYDLSSDDSKVVWYVSIRLSIDASLESTYKTAFYRPTDTTCDAMLFDALDISKLEITGKVISEESIVANGLNETFIYHSDNSELLPKYTLIYVNSEKLYFGRESGSNLGETPETRHSSISLADYFTQVIK